MVIRRMFYMLLAMLAGVLVTACDKNKDEKEIETHRYAVAMVKEGQFYVATFSDLKEGVEVKASDAVLMPKGHLHMHFHGGALYLMSGSMGGIGGEQKLCKYKLDEHGHLAKTPEVLVFKGSPNPVEVAYTDQNKAYISTNGAKAEVIVISLDPLKEIGRIDISRYAFKDNDPDAGNGYVRDGKFFLPLNQVASMMEIRPCPGQLLVIDVATDKIEKSITDDRVTSLGMLGHTNVIEDEAGNLYFQTGPRAAMTLANPEAPAYAWGEGILRIKKGDTDFDKGYHLPVNTLPSAEKGSYFMTWVYGGNDKAYCFMQLPSKGGVDKNSYFPYEISLNAKTGKLIDLPASNGWSATGVLRKENKIFFAIATKTEGNGIYSYDLASGKSNAKPIVKTELPVYKIVRLGE